MKKIISGFIIFIYFVIFCNKIYAKYNYFYELNAFSLLRDDSEIQYQIIRSDDGGQYTNKDVLLQINANKELKGIDGFELSQDRKSLSKILRENENNQIILKDLSGNIKNVEYNINSIDKEPPQIIGVENNGISKSNLKLQYTDNIGVEKIYIDKYSDNLEMQVIDDFYDTNWHYGMDITGNNIHVNMINHPEDTKFYKYYLNNTLIEKSEINEYVFTNLSYGTTYNIRVEALNETDNVIGIVSRNIKTSYFSNLETYKDNENFIVKINNIDGSFFVDSYALWNDKYPQRFYNATIQNDRSLSLGFNAKELDGTINKGYYYFHIVFRNNLGNTFTIAMNVVFGEKYVKNDKIDPYNITANGKYKVMVTDFAGNQITKKFIIQK